MKTLFPINFSPSMLSDIYQCELYFFRKHCQRLAVKAENPHLLAGSAFAKACETVRQAYYFGKLLEEEAIEAGQNYIYSCPETGSEQKSLDKLAFALGQYFLRFPLNSNFTPSPLANGGYAIEYDILIDLGIPHPDIKGETLKFRSRIDAVYDLHLAGQKTKSYLIDEKTTQRITRVGTSKVPDVVTEGKKYLLSNQFVGYSWALFQVGHPVEDIIIRRVPLLKEHEDAYEIPVHITQFQRDQWSKGMYNKIIELTQRYLYWKEGKNLSPQDAFTPEYDTGCTYYNRICDYAAGCIHKEGEEMLAARYQQLVWDSAKQEEQQLEDYLTILNLK